MKKTGIKKNWNAPLWVFAIFLTLLFVTNVASAQTPDFVWAQRAGGTSVDQGQAITSDATGNNFIVGYFYGSASFGSITLTSAGSSDIVIAKYDASGNVLWAQRAGGTSVDYGYGITNDWSGGIIITGAFSGSATFGSITLTSAGINDIFIAKYDYFGNLQWAKRAGGTNSDYGRAITTDSGDIIVTGYFYGSATFGAITLTSAGNNDIFIAKYDALGNVLWAQRAGGSGYDLGMAITRDRSGNCTITGSFSGSATFGSITLTSAGSSDIFITQYDGVGNVRWARRAGGSLDSDGGDNIAIDGGGNPIITGHFGGSATFGSITLTSAGSYDVFIAKYNTSGTVLWAKRAGGADTDVGRGIATDGLANIFVAGNFLGSINFDGISLPSAGSYDIFIAKYDDSGNLQWVTSAGGTDYDYAYDIATDGANNSITTGHFAATATFGSIDLTSAGSSDVFIAKVGAFGPSRIDVTTPNGGEVWLVGKDYEITWDSDNYTGRVRIDISTTAGRSWWDVTEGNYTANNGSYFYAPVKENISASCLFRITSVENPSAEDDSDNTFTIIEKIKHYVAVHVPYGTPAPVIDGDLSDAVWSSANGPEVLQFGGPPDAFLIPWSSFSDNKVTWRAVWSATTNLLYVAIEIQDDIMGAVDNDYDNLWQDDCIELYTDGDHNGGNYSGSSFNAQQWLIRRDNAKHLSFTSGAYAGSAINSAVKYGSNGNWVLELAIIIYDHYPSDIRPLAMYDVIGWEAWYDDSDNTRIENSKWARDHQVGWGYVGPAYYNADAFMELELGPAPYLPPYMTVQVPNGGENWPVGTTQTISWTSSNTSGSVKIELTRNGGSTWETLFASIPDAHSQAWTVTGPISINCRIKITDVDGSPTDMSDQPFTISAPDITIDPTSWNYGSVNVGSYSDKTFLIRNDGNANLNVTATTISGTNALEFSIQSGGGSFTLNPGAIRNLVVRFSPTSAGGKSASLSIANNDYDENPLIVNLSGGTGPEWKVPITITAGNVILTRTFGGDANATDGFDSGLDVAAAPPGMTYYAYFELPVFPNYLETDIRRWIAPYTSEVSWTLKIVNATGITSILSWNTSHFPTTNGMFTLSGAGADINMKSQNAATVPGTATLTIKYTLVDVVTWTFLQQGWYLISLPVAPTNNNLSALFPTALAAFGYNSATGSYYSVTSLETRKGYWLLIPAVTTVMISGTRLSTFTEHYTMGWHLIGTVRGTTNFTDPQDVPNGAVLSAWGYNPVIKQYVQVYPPGTGLLEEKQGYWLAAILGCDLTIGGSKMSAASMLASGNIELFKQQFGSEPPAPPFVTDQAVAQLLPNSHKILSRNYPNPFNPETVIEYLLPKAGLTQVYIYNGLGQRIRTLYDAPQQVGTHQAVWNGRNDSGELMTNGLYFYKIISSELVETQKILFLK